jgi:PKD repeat protein
VISPTSLSIKGNALEANYSENVFEMVNCVNGMNYTTSPCESSDGPGIVHSTALAQGKPPNGFVYGMLLTINYTVIRAGSYSPLRILKAIITNDDNPVLVTIRDGTYGIPPGQGFSLATSPDSARMVIGSKANVTVTISSSGGYRGTVDLTLTEKPDPGLILSLNATSTPLSPDHSSNVTLTIAANSTHQTSQHMITVTATSNGLSHAATVSIWTIDTPDFTLDASPLILEIHSADSGRSTITLDTQSGFSGSIRLSVTRPDVPGLTVSLSARNLMISPGRPATTVLDIHTPDSAVPFVYLVNITATSSSSSYTLTLVVRPPPPDFTFLLASAEFVVQVGQALTSTVRMTSIDYFKGELHLSASPEFGAEEAFSPPDIPLDFGNSSTSIMTLTTDANSPPGSYNVTLTAMGTTLLGASVTHIIVMIVTITQGPPSKTIFGILRLTYYGTIGALGLVAIAAAVSGIRKLRQRRFRAERNREQNLVSTTQGPG